MSEMGPQLPPRPAVGRVPMFPSDSPSGKPTAGLGISLNYTVTPSIAPAAARSPQQSASEGIPPVSNVSARSTVDATGTEPTVKRKPVGSSTLSESSNQSASRPPQASAMRGASDSSCIERLSAEQYFAHGDKPDTSLEQPLPYASGNTTRSSSFVEQLEANVPPQFPEEAAETGFRNQPQYTHQYYDQFAAEEDEVDQPKPSSGSQSEVSSKMDLSLGQEKLGGGSDGEQAKLGKLIVWSEGQKMLDLIVSANVMLFHRLFNRAYQAANTPRKGA